MKTSNTPSTHPLAKGTVVDVQNMTLGGKLVVEGRATICSPVRGVSDRYNVRFHSDGHRMTYERFVMPANVVPLS